MWEIRLKCLHRMLLCCHRKSQPFGWHSIPKVDQSHLVGISLGQEERKWKCLTILSQRKKDAPPNRLHYLRKIIQRCTQDETPQTALNFPFRSAFPGHLCNWDSSHGSSWDNKGPSKGQNEETCQVKVEWRKLLWSWVRGKKSPSNFPFN